MSDLYAQAMEAFRAGDQNRARELAEQLRREGREIDGLCMLARVALREGDAAEVTRLATAAREQAADESQERMPLHLQAAAARVAGKTDEARTLYQESIELNRRLDTDFLAAEHHNLGYVELHAGNLARAKELFDQALAEARRRENHWLLPYLVLDRGVIAIEEGDAQTGVRLIEAGRADFAARGEMIDPDDDAEVSHALEKAHRQLDDGAFWRAQDEGRDMSLHEALA